MRIKSESAMLIWRRGANVILLISSSILAAGKLAQYEPGKREPDTRCAIADSTRWAEQIMEEIDQCWGTKERARMNVNPVYRKGTC